jgi:methyltransferase (TIGR00027 family)
VSPRIIDSVADTARWLALYRTQESTRPDALFRDRLAERFVGTRGHALAAAAPWQLRNGWPIVVRTKLVDDLVVASLAEGCDCVVNLAAGFDTRPYRLALPASLSWIEADLPGLIEEKERLLRGERPACRVVRETVDLGDAGTLAALLARSTQHATATLVITEGVLVYLDEHVVHALAGELLAQTTVRWWVLDVASPAIVEVIQRGMGEQITGAPLKFAPADGVAFFEALGWRATHIRSLFPEAVRLHRLPLFIPPGALHPDTDPRRPGTTRWSGVVRLERAPRVS